MLDPGAEAEGPPLLASGLEGVERLAVGQVSDRVHRQREAGAGGRADQLHQLVAARDLHARPVEQARRLRAQCPVHEGLQVAEPQERAAEAAADLRCGELVCLLGGQ